MEVKIPSGSHGKQVVYHTKQATKKQLICPAMFDYLASRSIMEFFIGKEVFNPLNSAHDLDQDDRIFCTGMDCAFSSTGFSWHKTGLFSCRYNARSYTHGVVGRKWTIAGRTSKLVIKKDLERFINAKDY